MNPHHPVAQSIYTPIAEMYGCTILRGSSPHMIYAEGNPLYSTGNTVRFVGVNSGAFLTRIADDLGITETQLQDIREFATAYQNLVS